MKVCFQKKEGKTSIFVWKKIDDQNQIIMSTQKQIRIRKKKNELYTDKN